MSLARQTRARELQIAHDRVLAPVSLRRDGLAAHVVLQRPRQLNALSHDMVSQLRSILDEIADDGAVEVVVIRGSGTRAWSVGGDLPFLRQEAAAGGAQALAFWRDLYALAVEVASFPKPIVAVMDGFVLGGGLGIAGRATHRIVTERSVLGMPETRIGFFPDTGGLHLLAGLPGELGTMLGLCAQTVGASDAIESKLADAFCWSADVPSLLDRLATQRCEDVVLGLDRSAPMPGALDRSWVDPCFAGDDVEVILRRLHEHGDPAARAAGALLAERSPTMVAVTLWGLRRAAEMSLPDDVAMELALAEHLHRHHDFAEGIRARLVDKDRDPQWRPRHPDEVDLDWLDVL